MIHKLSGLFFIIMFFLPAYGQNKLSGSEIEQYISSLSDLNQMGSRKENIDESKQIPPSNGIAQGNISLTPITDSLEFIRKQPDYNEFLSTIQKHGFKTPEDWSGVGDKIMTAYTAYHLINGPAQGRPAISEMLNDLKDQYGKIENNKFISTDQKQTLMNNIQNSMAMLNNPTYIENENIPVISPYIKRLDSLFKEPL